MYTHKSIEEADRQHVWHPFKKSSEYFAEQLLLVESEGPYVIDNHDNRYLDSISGLWNVNLGYSEQRIIEAIREQLETLPFASLIVSSNVPASRLAEKLAHEAPGNLDVTFFTSGGAEAVETAIKLARHAGRLKQQPLRQQLISLRGAYHGMTYGALSLTGVNDDRWQFGPLLSGVSHVSSPAGLPRDSQTTQKCVDDLLQEVEFQRPETIAAMIVEPVMGVAGMAPPPPGYLQTIRQICDDIGALLIFDEVTCGCGRTGRLFAAETFGILPDILVTAKGLSGGYAPLGAVVASRDLFDLCESTSGGTFMHGYTYGGSPTACAAGNKYLDILREDGLLPKVEEDGQYLLSTFRSALSSCSYVECVEGIGLLLSVSLGGRKGDTASFLRLAQATTATARKMGMLIRPSYGGRVFNFAPPFICTPGELGQMASTFSEALIETCSKV